MPSITLKDVELMRSIEPRRCCFAQHPSIRKSQGDIYSVSLKFPWLGKLFTIDTGIVLRSGRYGPYTYLSDSAQIELALKWQTERESFVFLRDNLSSSLALDFNLASAGIYTSIGQAEHDAKARRSSHALQILLDGCLKAISLIRFHADCPLICAVPPSPDKEWDLPTELVKRIVSVSGQADISAKLGFARKKANVKSLSLKDKWKALEAARLHVDVNVKGKNVLLVDDKYQSGTTAQFVAAELYAAGATEVHGLFCVKTWRYTDNQ